MMRIVGRYSFNGGEQYVQEHYESQLLEIKEIIASVDAETCRSKRSKEKTMLDRALYSPKCLNKAFQGAFVHRGWNKLRLNCDYSAEFYVDGYQPSKIHRRAYREMDYIKDQLGVEVQFGKYAFMVYNVCAKMTIFCKSGFIKAGVEIVPVREFTRHMSTGVSYFEQFVWDLQQRGISDIDIPVLILGII